LVRQQPSSGFLWEGTPFSGLAMEEATVDLRRLRDEAWKHFVAPEDRRVFATDTFVEKRHPTTKESLGSYRLLGDPELAARSEVAVAWRMPAPALTRDEWTAVLCTGHCQMERHKGSACGARARCALGSGPLRPGLDCLAEALQLHPQADTNAIASPPSQRKKRQPRTFKTPAAREAHRAKRRVWNRRYRERQRPRATD
jgi:hypothetical protein